MKRMKTSNRFVWQAGDVVFTKTVSKGDTPGHEFHGNQYTGGEGGTATLERPEILPWQKSDEWDGVLKSYDWIRQNCTGFTDQVGSGMTPADSNLTSAEKNAFTAYTVSGFQNINTGLRTGEYPSGKAPAVDIMQKAIMSNTLKTGAVVFRGVDKFNMGANKGNNNTLSSGDIFTDKGFVSTSLRQPVAENFSRSLAIPAVAEITVPAGSNAIGILQNESELVLPSGSSFRIDSDEGGVVKMTYLGVGVQKGIFQPNFQTFTNTDIVRRAPLEGEFKGNQNNGFTYVDFADGSRGIEKQMKDWYGNKTGRLYKAEVLAAQEFLASRVGAVMNAPVRDCLFSSTDAKTVIMPYILGESGEERGGDDVPDNHQGASLRLFDYLTANSDRRPKNLMFATDGRIVGIDHALCNFRLREPSPELISQLWNHGVNAESLLILKPKLETLRGIFTTIGMSDKFDNMMANLESLIDKFQKIENYATIQKGDIEGHPFHGNQYETGESGGSVSPDAKQFITDSASKFFSKGGKVTFYDCKSSQDSYDKFPSLWGVGKGEGGENDYSKGQAAKIDRALASSEKKLENTTDPEMKTQVLRITNGYRMMEDTLNDFMSSGGKMIVATDKNDQICAIMRIGNTDAKGNVYIPELGSTNKVPGAATAIQYELAKYASENGWGVTATAGRGAEGYHQAIGRTTTPTGQIGEDGYVWNSSSWTPQQCAEIASLSVKNPNIEIAKGDVEGHVFHGNQYEAGQGGEEIPVQRLVRAWSITDNTDKWRQLSDSWSQQLQNAVLNAPPSKSELFSGVSVPPNELEQKYGIGKELKMTLASFTDKPSVARDFASKREGYKIYSTPRSNLKVILHLPAGTKALDTNQYGGVARFHEQIVSGDFVVVSQSKSAGYTNVYLQQKTIQKGDVAGHAFHGNQYTGGIRVYRGVTSSAGRQATLDGSIGRGTSGDALYMTSSYDMAHAYANGYGTENPTEPHVMSGTISPSAKLIDSKDLPDEIANEPESEWLKANGYDGMVIHHNGGGIFGDEQNDEVVIVNPSVVKWDEEDAKEPGVEKAKPNKHLVEAEELREDAKIAQLMGDFDGANELHYKAMLEREKAEKITKGDKPGHEFHGNQYEKVGGFQALKTTEVAKKLGNKKILGGVQNTGFTKVELADGSIGIIKHGMTQEDADKEVLASKIGKALDAPVRDAVIIKKTPSGRCDVLSPFVDGKVISTDEDLDPSEVAETMGAKAQTDMARVQFLDEAIGNPDRNVGNVMVFQHDGTERLLGIDHGLSFSYEPDAHELLDLAQSAHYSNAEITRADKKMQSLTSDASVPESLRMNILNETMPAWNGFMKEWSANQKPSK